MTFKVIDTKTGKEPTDRVLTNIACKGGLMEMDIDGFYIGEDGDLVLADDCGNVTWVDRDRFKVAIDVLEKIRAEIDEEIDGESHCDEFVDGYQEGLKDALEIIDRYREGESE